MSLVSLARSVFLAFALAAACAAASCDGAAHDPGKHVVAVVGGQPVTVSDVQAYLDANLLTDPAADPLPPRDLARVKSRLFDDYLDGELLLQEARRRGLTVSDAELAEYLGADAPASPKAREVARRDLLIQKLRESVVRAEVRVDDAQVEAWLQAHPMRATPDAAGPLRTLRFASYPEAMRVRNEIVSKKLSFAQAQASYGADSLSDAGNEADLGAFPDHIAAAIKALSPGQVSQPLPFESSVLLFLLEAPEDPAAVAARRREQARQAIALDESQSIADGLIESLRKGTPIVRHPDELPFPYVAEGAVPHAE
jgi:parvulin-like peptidyl-prolyl isomerase